MLDSNRMGQEVKYRKTSCLDHFCRSLNVAPVQCRAWEYDHGLFSSVVLCFSVTYPLDVVRRRMQMKGISGDLFAYTSTRHAFSMIVQVEGIKGLYKGMWPNLLKVTPDSIIDTLWWKSHSGVLRVSKLRNTRVSNTRKTMQWGVDGRYYSYGATWVLSFAAVIRVVTQRFCPHWRPLVGEKRCVTTLIKAAKETAT